jgi:hypothetical protein
MTYQKPKVTDLGDASRVILGVIPRQLGFESSDGKPQLPLDTEFDD